MAVAVNPIVNVRRFDPTGTLGLRSRFVADMRVRFRSLAKKIQEYILAVLDRPAISLNAYDFPSDPKKMAFFLAWLKEQEDANILYVQQGPERYLSSVPEQWTDKYIQSAYKKGATDAYVRAGFGVLTGLTAEQYLASAFFAPIHADALSLLYTRTFSELKGITAAMDQRITRILADGLVQGISPRKIARNLAREVGLSSARAERMARTEIIRAHAESTLNSYESFGVEGVKVLAELLTAGDDRVCARCAELEGKVYTIQEARGLIPLHPNCRCCYIPVL